MAEHAERAHALLSASGSHRWMNCTGSPSLERLYPDESSIYADEGTLAHELAELELKRALGWIGDDKDYRRELRRIRKHELFSLDMPRQVDKYVSVVIEKFNELVAKFGEEMVTISIEERLDFSNYVPEGFGTGDANIISPISLHVYDLKYGKGVPVFADENSQLMLYGVGAYNAYELIADIKTVTLNVVQPRLDSFSSWDISAEDLIEWAETTVKPLAEKAYGDAGEFKAGEWCKWCRAKATCRTLAERNLELAKYEFCDPNELNPAELMDVFSKLDLLGDWTNAVKDHMYKKALSGKKIEGFKLVAGRSVRKWSDADAVKKALRANGYSVSQYINKKIKGIGDISDLMSVDEFDEVLGHLVIKPEGKPALVPISDKRPELNNAKDEFDDGFDDAEDLI